MCALRCQLTVRIEEGPGTSSSNPLCSSCALSTSSHPIPLIQLFQQLQPPTCVVCGHQKSPRPSIYKSYIGCQFGKRLDCIKSNCQANACLCVCMCVSHMSAFVSHQVGSHTLHTTPHSSTQLHRTPHSSTELHMGKERVPGVDVLYSFRRSLPPNALVASHTCRMHQRLHRTQRQTQ